MAAVKRSLNVGVVGMGKMGVSITRNLAFKGRSAMYLQIHSRSLAKARKVCDDLSVDGATCAMRLHDKYSTMSKWCDVMLLTLRDPTASRHVLLEHPDSLLRNARKGQIIIDHTTVDVETSRECEYEARKRGAFFLDAPMSGSPKSAFNGQLTLMVGGDAETFQRCQSIFRLYADQIHLLGAAGSGSAAKGISQMLVAIHNAAAAEALKAAHELGVEDVTKLMQVLDASWGSSTMLRRNGPTMQDLIRNPDRLPPVSSASVDALLGDVALLKGIDRDAYPLLSTSTDVLTTASEAGVGDRDMASVIHFLDAAKLNAALHQRELGDSNPSSDDGVAPVAAAAAAAAPTAGNAVETAPPPPVTLPEDVEFY